MSIEESYYYGLMIPFPFGEQIINITVRFHGTIREGERAKLPMAGAHIIEWAVPTGHDSSTLYGLGSMPVLCHGNTGYEFYEARYAQMGTMVTVYGAINSGLWMIDPFENERGRERP